MKRCFYIVLVTFISILFFFGETSIHIDSGKSFVSHVDEVFTNEKVLACNSGISNNALPREVFLTFDDGPSINNTKKVLKILRENNVKATFFVVGVKGEENPEILKEINKYGMSIGVHTYSHDYKKIYKNLDGYLKDIQACSNVIKKITGTTPISYVRFPGGSNNLATSKVNLHSIKVTLNHMGISYVDWNVSAGDAESKIVSPEKIKQNIISQSRDKRLAVILMHDTYYKNSTVAALPGVIEYLKQQGFVFRTFNDLTAEEEKEMIRLGIINRS